MLKRFPAHSAIDLFSRLRDKFVRVNRRLNNPFRFGILILSFFCFVALLAPVISPFNPYEMGDAYLSPSSTHLLGTNDIGQDILSELIYGTRISLFIGIVASLIVTAMGTMMGIISGYNGGLYDKIIMQIISIAMSIPSLPIIVLLTAYLGSNIWHIIISLCLLSWTGTARIIRAKVLQLKEMPFIKIEQTLGANRGQIVKHILPNISDLVLIRAVLRVPSAMLTETGLSFLGLGSHGMKSWGNIIHYAFVRNGVINNFWWWYLPPIICISLCVLGFMLLSYSESTPQKFKSQTKLSKEFEDA
jgi:peptide/nickel transport system permease protein